ncbi:hypothetical protein [Spirosoma fluminis]
MQIFMMGQRKGLFLPYTIHLVTEADVPQIIDYLKPHWKKLNRLWTPLSVKVN